MKLKKFSLKSNIKNFQSVRSGRFFLFLYKNAADEVARQYHQNIQEIHQLSQQRWLNKESALSDMKVAFDTLAGNYLNGLGNIGQFKEWKFKKVCS